MSIAVATLIVNAKVLSDKTTDGSIDDNIGWTMFANRATMSLWRLVSSLDPTAFFNQSDFTLTATPGGSIKDLTTITGYNALHGLDLSPDTMNRRTIRPRNWNERNMQSVAWWVPTTFDDDRRYDIRGKNLVITPYENAAGSYRAYIRTLPTQWANAADATFLDSVLEPHVEYIEIRMARAALGIEESDTGFLSQELSEVAQEVVAAHTRDDGGVLTIADIEETSWGR